MSCLKMYGQMRSFKNQARQRTSLKVKAVKSIIRRPWALPVCRTALLTSPTSGSIVVVLLPGQSSFGAGQQGHSMSGFAAFGSGYGMIIVVDLVDLVVVVVVVELTLGDGLAIPYMVSSSLSQRSSSGSSGHPAELVNVRHRKSKSISKCLTALV